MKKVAKLVSTAAMISVLSCMPAIAEESSPHSLSGTVTFGTDYYWRGMSSTDNGPSVQGEIDYEHKTGFYAGIWGGNIAGDSSYVDDFDEWTYATDSANLELDFWAGYWKEVGPIELDLMAIYYYYPDNADSGLNRDPEILDWTKGEAEADMVELHIGLAYRFDIPTTPKFTVGYDFSPDYWGEDGTGHHLNGILDIGLPADIGLVFEAGYQSVAGDKQSGCDGAGTCYGTDEGEGFDYSYYKIGVNRDFFNVNFDLSYWHNSEEDWFENVYGTSAKDQVVFTAAYTF